MEKRVYAVEEGAIKAHVDHCKMLVLDHNTASLRAYRSIEKCVRLDKEVMGVFLVNWVP